MDSYIQIIITFGLGLILPIVYLRLNSGKCVSFTDLFGFLPVSNGNKFEKNFTNQGLKYLKTAEEEVDKENFGEALINLHIASFKFMLALRELVRDGLEETRNFETITRYQDQVTEKTNSIKEAIDDNLKNGKYEDMLLLLNIKQWLQEDYEADPTQNANDANVNDHPSLENKDLTTQDQEDDAILSQFRSKLLESTPKITLQDIDGFQPLKNELLHNFIYPKKSIPFIPEEMSTSMLLFGAPGNGKSFFANALAGELGYKFISIKGSDILDQYHGQSVRRLNICFEMAKKEAPSIVFFDELDCLFPSRGDESTSQTTGSLLSEFVQQADDVKVFNKSNLSKHVIIFAATNYPSKIDEAVWRRLAPSYYVPMPNADDRKALLKKQLGFDITSQFTNKEWQCIINNTEEYSCYDITRVIIASKKMPKKRLYGATHFISNEVEGKQMWKPCSESLPGGVEKNWQDIDSTHLHKDTITAIDVIIATECTPPTTKTEDKKGILQTCMEFNKKYGTPYLEQQKIVFPDELDRDKFVEQSLKKGFEKKKGKRVQAEAGGVLNSKEIDMPFAATKEWKEKIGQFVNKI